MRTIIDIAFDKHKEWIKVVKSFGCNPSQAEDVVQEMYLQLHKDLNKGLDFTYKDDINHYYCYKVLRGIFCNIYKKEARKLKAYLEELKTELQEFDENEIDEKEYQERQDKVGEVMSNLYWYDAKVFELIASGKSVASLSRETKISYYSLYNTYRNALKHIKENT
jgi:RNA polymerase sigma factor (sigma-70 family)